MDKGAGALFLGKVESGKSNFEVEVEVVSNKYNDSRSNNLFFGFAEM